MKVQYVKLLFTDALTNRSVIRFRVPERSRVLGIAWADDAFWAVCLTPWSTPMVEYSIVLAADHAGVDDVGVDESTPYLGTVDVPPDLKWCGPSPGLWSAFLLHGDR